MSLRSSARHGAGKVQTLLLLGVNPVYDAPADFGFAELLGKVKLAVHLGLHDDETAGRCHWHVPAAHWLESWSDARSWDGTVSIVQPLIAPLYGGKTGTSSGSARRSSRPHRYERSATFSARRRRAGRSDVAAAERP